MRNRDVGPLFGSTPARHVVAPRSLITELVGATCPVDGGPCNCPNATGIALVAFISRRGSGWLEAMSLARQSYLENVAQAVANEAYIEEQAAIDPNQATSVREMYEALTAMTENELIQDLHEHAVEMRDVAAESGNRFSYEACPHHDH